MFRRGFALSSALAMIVLFASIGVDIRGVYFRPTAGGASPPTNAFPLPGPRRYPPAYRAGSLAYFGALDAGHTSHQTVIKN